MYNLNINNLEKCFTAAKNNKARFIGVKILMDNYPSPEIIINEYPNYDKKLDYYKVAYNEDLTLKANPSIKIIGFTYGNNFLNIQEDLI